VNVWLGLLASLACLMVAPASAQQQQQKPNILVIIGVTSATGTSAPTTAA
jgi:hypothetical protein